MEKEDFKKDPLGLMTAVIIDSSLKSYNKIIDLINKYEANGVDVIPISEIRQALNEARSESLSDKGLLKAILND